MISRDIRRSERESRGYRVQKRHREDRTDKAAANTTPTHEHLLTKPH